MSVLIMVVACAAAARSFAEQQSLMMTDPPIEIIINNPIPNSQGPRMPAFIPISGVVDDALNAAILSFSYNCGTVSVEMINSEDGSLVETVVEGVGTVMIPFSLTPGYWTVTLTLESGVVYQGHFELD